MEKLQNFIYSLLRKSEKYTEIDMVYWVENGFWLTLGCLISTLASFFLTIAFANLLDPITYGNYQYILSIFGILGIFGLVEMEKAVSQAVARGLEGSFYTGFKMKFKWGLLGSLIALGLAGYFWVQGSQLLSISLLLNAFFLPLMLASGVCSSYLMGKKLFSLQVKYGTISRIGSVLAVITTLFLTKSLVWLTVVYFASCTFFNYFFYLLVKSKFQPNKIEDSETLAYGKHLSFIKILQTIARHLDRILIFHYLGVTEVAVYQLARAPIERIKSLFDGSIPSLALVKFSQKTKQEIKSISFRKILKFSLILLPIVSLYILIAPLLYKTFFPRYSDSVFYSQILSLSLLAMPAHYFGSPALQSQKAKKQLYQLYIIAPIFRIALLCLLVYFYGLMGAVLARVIAYFFSAGFSLWLTKKI